MIFLLVSTSILCAQQSPTRVEVSSIVDTSNSEIDQVIRLWENYLNSKPDSSYINPWWSELEQRQYNPYDLVTHTWWGISLYAWLPRCHVNVLSVSRVGESFVIRTMFYHSLPRDSGKVTVISIIQTGGPPGKWNLQAMQCTTHQYSLLAKRAGWLDQVCFPARASVQSYACRTNELIH